MGPLASKRAVTVSKHQKPGWSSGMIRASGNSGYEVTQMCEVPGSNPGSGLLLLFSHFTHYHQKIDPNSSFLSLFSFIFWLSALFSVPPGWEAHQSRGTVVAAHPAHLSEDELRTKRWRSRTMRFFWGLERDLVTVPGSFCFLCSGGKLYGTYV